ncbi:MAG: beta-ketoacyl-[acyl-carrier-protein] synthase family protein [Syntrophales bacterium]|jgi:3-oxoacyl-[acyl-carrier-protein] synthase II
MSRQQPVILGYDIVSPLGVDMETQWALASKGASGIGALTRFPLRDDFPVRIAGQVEDVCIETYPFLASRDMALWSSPIFRYAILVVKRALTKSGIEITQKLSPRVGITFSSAVGGLDAVIHADRHWVASGKLPPPYTNANSCISMVGGKVSIMTGATGPITSTITACATGVTSMIIGAMFIETGVADVVICGAVDFPLVEPILGGFATMNGSYRQKNGQAEDPPEKASRPFSINRRGFVVSEGAGCVILASKIFAKAYGLKPRIEMAGWAMTSDAHHFVAPNLDTVKRCIAQSIANADLQPGDIDAVNAHATSTKIGDKIEGDALRDIFRHHIPPISANKSQLGHAMGASSAIEIILAMEGMIRGSLLPTINYTADPDIAMDFVAEGTRSLDQECVLKNAFGFGGCNACIVLRKIL